jgi:uncharacterized protein
MEQVSEMGRRIDSFFIKEDGIVAVFLFGSVVQGRNRAGSDIDLALLLDERTGKVDRKLLLDRPIPALGRILRRDIHLLVLNDASCVTRIEAMLRGKLIHCKDPIALAEFRMVSLVLFADFAPCLRGQQRNLRQRLAGEDGY